MVDRYEISLKIGSTVAGSEILQFDVPRIASVCTHVRANSDD